MSVAVRPKIMMMVNLVAVATSARSGVVELLYLEEETQSNCIETPPLRRFRCVDFPQRKRDQADNKSIDVVAFAFGYDQSCPLIFTIERCHGSLT